MNDRCREDAAVRVVGVAGEKVDAFHVRRIGECVLDESELFKIEVLYPETKSLGLGFDTIYVAVAKDLEKASVLSRIERVKDGMVLHVTTNPYIKHYSYDTGHGGTIEFKVPVIECKILTNDCETYLDYNEDDLWRLIE